ncbi:uncharacterized protein LOC128223413 [Mya arenaria]|uniref:uncharacterized protein LOC128223413 n=1 Tax=Mya arenaria TaxID=6604 RepID=UPI0022E52817|nr:uncharacterized protein LOC128223413 [Mya arenaria]
MPPPTRDTLVSCNNKYFSSDKVTAVKAGYCWKYSNHRFTMKSAADTCRKLHARLPAINTVAKTRAITKFISASRKADPKGEIFGHEFWVSPVKNSRWKYTQAKVSYKGSTEKGSLERGLMCVLFNYRTGKWRYSDCSGHHPTVCEEAHKYPNENPKASTAPKTPKTNRRRKMPPSTNKRQTVKPNTNRRQTLTPITNRRRTMPSMTKTRRTMPPKSGGSATPKLHNTTRGRTMPTSTSTTMPSKRITAALRQQQQQNVTHATPKPPSKNRRRTKPISSLASWMSWNRKTAASRQQRQRQKSVRREHCQTGFYLHKHLCFMLVKAHGTVQAEFLCHKHRAVLASFTTRAHAMSIQSFVQRLTPEYRGDRGVLMAPVKRTRNSVVWLLSNKYAEAALKHNGVDLNSLHKVDAIYAPYKGGLHVCRRNSCPRRGLCMAKPTLTHGELYGSKSNDDYINLV